VVIGGPACSAGGFDLRHRDRHGADRVLLNGLVLMNVSSYIQQIIIGIIIVLAVAFDTFAKSRRRKA